MDTKQFKLKILDLAIKGKLCPQNASDEPASELIKRIREEKAKLVKEKKIKASKTDSYIYRKDDGSFYERIGKTETCIDDEIPFEIPASWEWVRLHSLGEIVGGGTPDTKEELYWKAGDIPWITPAYMAKWDFVFLGASDRCITSRGLERSSAKMLSKGSIIYSSRAPIGYIAIVENPLCTSQGCKSVDFYLDDINLYIYYSLKALTPLIINRATGTTFKEISGKEFGQTLIPVSSFAEQNRIVGTISQMNIFIDWIERSQQKLNQNMAAARTKLLDLAIKGKLVPQNPDDEPASKLLERIQAEKQALIKASKLKPSKVDSTIYQKEDGAYYERIGKTENCIDSEIPFPIPQNWAWTRLSSITSCIAAGGDKPNVFSSERTEACSIPIYSNGQKNEGLYGFTDVARIHEPSITISARGLIGFSCIRKQPYVPIIRLITVTPFNSIDIHYLQAVCASLLETGVGTSIPQLTVPMVVSKLIPLPPVNEQKLVVSTLTDILKFIS